MTHFNIIVSRTDGPACGASLMLDGSLYDTELTEDSAKVTCPECLQWLAGEVLDHLQDAVDDYDRTFDHYDVYDDDGDIDEGFDG